METFIEYQRYPDLAAAKEILEHLDESEIPYQVDNSGTHFDLAPSSISPLDKQIIIKIREEDFEKVNSLIENKVTEPKVNENQDHYLYTFSDDDIIDVIVNPEEWTVSEVNIAKQISKQRLLKPTADLVKSKRKEKVEAEKKETAQTKISISIGHSWFLWIAILSIINTVDFTFNKKLFFIFGLGITQLVDGVIGVLGPKFLIIGFSINIIISSFFILFWYYAKKKQQWAYLSGIILYGLDTIIFILALDWLSLGFHVFALAGIWFGFQSLLQSNKTTVA